MADNGFTIKVVKNKTAAKNNDINQVAKDDAKQNDYQKAAVSTAIINTGKQAILSGVNQYFALTGDTTSANSLSATIGLAADLMTMSTGPIGIISVVSNKAISAVNSAVQTYQANKQISFANSTLGEISRSGSRYF